MKRVIFMRVPHGTNSVQQDWLALELRREFPEDCCFVLDNGYEDFSIEFITPNA